MDYLTILRNAYETKSFAQNPVGCCRVYLSIADKEHAKGIAKAAKKLGKIFQKRGHGGMTNVLYIGYDNCSGVEMGQAKAIEACLRTNGIVAYTELAGD